MTVGRTQGGARREARDRAGRRRRRLAVAFAVSSGLHALVLLLLAGTVIAARSGARTAGAALIVAPSPPEPVGARAATHGPAPDAASGRERSADAPSGADIPAQAPPPPPHEAPAGDALPPEPAAPDDGVVWVRFVDAEASGDAPIPPTPFVAAVDAAAIRARKVVGEAAVRGSDAQPGGMDRGADAHAGGRLRRGRAADRTAPRGTGTAPTPPGTPEAVGRAEAARGAAEDGTAEAARAEGSDEHAAERTVSEAGRTKAAEVAGPPADGRAVAHADAATPPDASGRPHRTPSPARAGPDAASSLGVGAGDEPTPPVSGAPRPDGPVAARSRNAVAPAAVNAAPARGAAAPSAPPTAVTSPASGDRHASTEAPPATVAADTPSAAVAPPPGTDGATALAPSDTTPTDDARALRAALGLGPAGARPGHGRATRGLPGGPVARAAVVEAEEGDRVAASAAGTPLGAYEAAVRAAVVARWAASRVPVEAMLADRHEVTLRFRILRNGEVVDIVFVEGSGVPALDALALAAIPPRLPRFPRNLAADSLVQALTLVLVPGESATEAHMRR